MLVEWRVRRRMVIAAEAGLATLRKRAFDNVHRLSVLTQNSEQRGRYVSRVTGDVDTMRDLMQWTGAGMVVAAFESTVVFVVMALYSWQLALVVLASYIPLLVVTMRIQPVIRRAFSDIRARMADLLGRTSEQLVGVATIRSYGVQERMRSRLREEIDGIARRERRAAWLASTSFSMTAFGQSLATGAALVVGTALGVKGDLSVGTVAAFALLVYMFSGPLMWIIEMLAEMQRAMVGWQRVIELVDAPTTVAEPESPIPLPDGKVDLTVESVRLTYDDDEEVLKGISLTVPAGKRLAVVGQTGSGKTSLARLLARFFDPTSDTSGWAVLTSGTSVLWSCGRDWPWCLRRASCLTGRCSTTCSTRAPIQTRLGCAPPRSLHSTSSGSPHGWRRRSTDSTPRWARVASC